MNVQILIFVAFVLRLSTSQTLEDLIREVFETKQNENIFEGNPKTIEKNNTFENNKKCGIGEECVKEYLCVNGQANTDGSFLIKSRFGADDEIDACPFLETCCLVNNTLENGNSNIKPEEPHLGCGYRNSDGIGFRISGYNNEAEYGEFPWMVAILRGKPDESFNIFQCGGSLIHPQVVLTGAHCVDKFPASTFKVRAGEWATDTKNEIYPDQDRQAVELIIHPEYKNSNLYNDIALLLLESPFDLTNPNVNTLCLPPDGFLFDFSQCFATGWGKNRFQNGKYSNILKKVKLRVVPSYVCQDGLRQTYLGKYFNLHSSFICAGGESGEDTCEGDGGSPLACPMHNLDNRYYQAGIVAWGLGCGEKNVPGVYANVPSFRNWIDVELAKRNIDPSYYTP